MGYYDWSDVTSVLFIYSAVSIIGNRTPVAGAACCRPEGAGEYNYAILNIRRV